MRKTYRNMLLYLFLFTVIFMIVLPIFLMFKIAVSEPGPFLNEDRFVFSLQSFKSVFQSGNIWPPLRKSATVAVSVALLSVLIAAPGAYVIAKVPGHIGFLFIIIIFFTRMFPEVGIALPVSLTFIRWGLFDTDPGLVLAHLIRVLPLVAWILLGTFKAIPPDLEQAGKVDGCTKRQVLTQIIFPIAKPGLAVGLIFGFLYSWDEFTYATYLSLQHKTLPLTVYYYVNRGGWFLTSTYAVIITLPVLLFTYYFQRYLQSGFLSGAVKA
jgi:trehalose transport system permease protein